MSLGAFQYTLELGFSEFIGDLYIEVRLRLGLGFGFGCTKKWNMNGSLWKSSQRQRDICVCD